MIPQILYSSLISLVINTLINFLAKVNGDILKLKEIKSTKGIKEKEIKLIKKFCIKFILFFIFGFIFLLFSWYYVSVFCAVYKNTQFHLIKDTIISFITNLVYPFVINILPGIFRKLSLSNIKDNRQLLYKFSKLLA